MKLTEIVPFIQSLWETFALPLVYAALLFLSLEWLAPEVLRIGFGKISTVLLHLQDPKLVTALEPTGLLKLTPIISLVLAIAGLLAIEKFLYAFGDVVPLDINSCDPARFLHTSRARLSFFLERLPTVDSPSHLQNYLQALSVEAKPGLADSVERWRNKAQTYGRRFRVAKGILLVGIASHFISAYGLGASSISVTNLSAFIFVALVVGLYYAVRLILAYEQIGYSESALFHQVLMLQDAPAADSERKTQAKAQAERWQADPSYHGWWRVKVFGLESLRRVVTAIQGRRRAA